MTLVRNNNPTAGGWKARHAELKAERDAAADSNGAEGASGVCFVVTDKNAARPDALQVFTCTDHDGHWVGVASVVVAPDQARAAELLDAELVTHGLKPGGYTLKTLATDREGAVVLQDGDY